MKICKGGVIMKRLTPRDLIRMSEGEKRKEYSRLRSIANKRIKRRAEARLKGRTDYFPTLSSIDRSKKVNIDSELLRVSGFTSTKQTTLKMVRKRIALFQDRMKKHYPALVSSERKALKAMRFMASVRQKVGNKQFDSGKALDVLEQGERLKIPESKLLEHYEIWSYNIENMENIPTPESKQNVFTDTELDNMVRKWE